MWIVYAIQNNDGNTYCGMTTNLRRRLKEHNLGKSTYTKNKGPWTVVFSKICSSRLEARREEKYLKGGAGRKIVHEHIARVAKLADAHA
ncbi:MAG: GIY-YIG nuclease family protein [Candidatus Roizmanbacteria bacterium]